MYHCVTSHIITLTAWSGNCNASVLRLSVLSFPSINRVQGAYWTHDMAIIFPLGRTYLFTMCILSQSGRDCHSRWSHFIISLPIDKGRVIYCLMMNAWLLKVWLNSGTSYALCAVSLYVCNFQLDMEDGDAIDVFQQQTGGHAFET